MGDMSTLDSTTASDALDSLGLPGSLHAGRNDCTVGAAS